MRADCDDPDYEAELVDMTPHRRDWKALIGDACIVGAIVMFAWSMVPG